MKKRISYLFKYILLFLFICFFFSCFKDLTKTNIVYSSNFSDNFHTNIEIFGWSNNGLFGAINDNRIGIYNGKNVLGKLNNNLIELKLVNLPDHQELRVEVDLLLHNKWQNNLWVMSIDGNYRLITGFSNDSTVQQSYPNWFGNGSPLSPAGKNAIETNLPMVCNVNSSGTSLGTTKYKIVSTLMHNNSTFTLQCSDAGGVFNDTCTRSWSIDNLKVSVFKN